MENLTLEMLCGSHVLSGVELKNENIVGEYGYTDTVNVCLFTLDGITYRLVEDPCDGYRSYCGDLCLVREEFYNGKWHKMASGVHRTVKEATDNFLRNAERTSEQRRLNREEQRLIRQCVESIELLHNGGEGQDGKRKAV